MKKFLLNTVVVVALLSQACSTKVYNNKSYLNQTSLQGKKVAILPAEVELTGRMPNNFSASKKAESEEFESKLIQSQIYNQYLFKSRSGGRKKQLVELVNVDQVNSKLQDAGIDIRRSWSVSPDSLGKLLGVDMVLKIRVKKNRIMSESASFGIGVATTVLGNILNGPNNQGGGISGSAKTYNMFFDATLSDVNTHTVITKFTHNGDASWSRSPEEVIGSSGRKIVRKGMIFAQ